MPGCNAVDVTDVIADKPKDECCTLDSAECYACSSGVTKAEYCNYSPTTNGCPKISDAKKDDEVCCALPVVRCISC